ncbi:hypothetical protein BZG36_04512 [Bifiguratus adelaidae]|uniref:BRCT domain-containing protein n=1 Tax=Bifiguratus adelaidae TaxID=1938954 RepID=A0A261XX74_9FUNG|nr:hypothetical protein BZG36_04512 [Bifiguratus adelaidae]
MDGDVVMTLATPVFEGVVFYINPNLAPERYAKASLFATVTADLEENGGRPAEAKADPNNTFVPRFDIEETTHLITEDLDFPEYQVLAASKSKVPAVVTPEWVDASLKVHRMEETKFFSADPSKFLSGVIAVSSMKLYKEDREKIAGALMAFGGFHDHALRKSTTHLITLEASGKKFDAILESRGGYQTHIVTPQWLEKYAIPDIDDANSKTESMEVSRNPNDLHLDKPPIPIEPSDVPTAKRTFLKGRRIYISDDVRMSRQMRTAYENAITDAGGQIINSVKHLSESILLDQAALANLPQYTSQNVDIFICKYRAGDAFVRASQDRKIVGSPIWLQYILHIGKLESPRLKLLHYPTPKERIKGMRDFQITISSYTGKAREYLKKLINLMGGIYTPHMTPSNTHLVCAVYVISTYAIAVVLLTLFSPEGEKFVRAREWNLNVVNHFWLEDCFATWELRSVSNPRYQVWPEKIDLGDYVGETQLTRTEPWYGATETLLEEDDHVPPKRSNGVWKGGMPTTPISEARGDAAISPIRTPRRAAAEVAERKLHDVVMPDANAWEKEKRSTPKRPKTSHPTSPIPRRTSDDKENVASATIASQVSPIQVSSIKPRRTFEEDQTVSPVTSPSDTPASRQTKSSNAAKAVEEDQPVARSLSSSRDDTTSAFPQEIRILTTLSDLTSKDQKAIQRMGAQMAKNASDCTHLISEQIARTEKFLCCLNKGCHIVPKKWLKDSISAGHFLSEDDYQVVDKKGEEKFKFSLRQSMTKSREGALLTDKQIYITSGVSPDYDIMKRIVESAQGVLLPAKTSHRALEKLFKDGQLIVISTQEEYLRGKLADARIPAYTSELILTGSLRQELPFRECLIKK